MAEKKIERNGLVDFMRLVFAVLVMMYHFYSDRRHFVAGRNGVEFFMILAGFLMFSTWRQKDISSLPLEERQRFWFGYVKKRYVRFFWNSLIAFVFVFCVVRIWHNQGRGIVAGLSGDIWEILLVKMYGINEGKGLMNGPAWTLGCMLFAEFLVLGILAYWERPFLTLWLPLSVVFGTSLWMNMTSNNHAKVYTFFTFGMLRVYVLTCVGIFSYWICQKLKEISFTRTGRKVFTLMELGGYAVCIWIACCKGSRLFQFCFILIATFVLAASFSGKSFAGSILPANKFTNFCAEYSFSLYLSHYPVLRIFRYTYEDIDDLYSQKFVFLICALTAALVYTFIMRGAFKMLPIVKQKLRSVMLEQT